MIGWLRRHLLARWRRPALDDLAPPVDLVREAAYRRRVADLHERIATYEEQHCIETTLDERRPRNDDRNGPSL